MRDARIVDEDVETDGFPVDPAEGRLN